MTRPDTARRALHRRTLGQWALLAVGGLFVVGGFATMVWITTRDVEPRKPTRSGSGGSVGAPSVAPDADGAPREEPHRATGAAPGELAEVRVERRLMGTIWVITVLSEDEPGAREAATAALDEVDRLERLLSEWRPTSEISEVNRQAGRAPVRVGPEMIACVRAALDVARWSEGAFDISWAALRDLWNFGPDGPRRPPTAEQVRARMPLWNWRRIRLDERASTIFLERAGMQIGLGGIAKGYAIDRAAEVLRARGFTRFLIFGGGQIYAGGARPDRPWRVGIQHPRANDYVAMLEATDASVATSGDYEHAFIYEGRRYHHIIDPATGFPSDRSASVTVVSPSALWADAVDTALFVMGPERGLSRLATAPGGPYDAVFIDPQMRVHLSPQVAPKLRWRWRLDTDGRLLEPLPGIPP
ncbi:MAG: FAD:protein FMN transferase [Myxococcales bacterium]|nr:FAD:protein FMN transferase [Myxococcales bacterium]